MNANGDNEIRLPATDPVCGMRIETVAAGIERRVYELRAYLFCSADCALKFDADSAAYIAASRILGENHGRARSAAEEERLIRDWLDADGGPSRGN